MGRRKSSIHAGLRWDNICTIREYDRLSGGVAGQALAHLYQAARLHVNYFQPSFKLLSPGLLSRPIRAR